MIDSHGHPVAEGGGPLDLSSINVQLAATADERAERARSSPSRLSHEILSVRLATYLDCEVEEVGEARGRASTDWPGYVRGLFADAGIHGVVLDPGWKLEATTAQAERFSELIGCPVRPILRLEPLIDQMIQDGAGAQEVFFAVQEAVRQAPASGYRGFKTIIAYRTGLKVDPESNLERAQRSLDETRGLPPRRRGKALRDLILRSALGWAAEMGMPFQIHTGFGDSEIRLSEANPLLLEELLQTPEGSAATVVLIHGSYPWHEELAFLTLARPNVYAEISEFNLYTVGTVAQRLEQILDFAPTARVLCGTDGHGHPETYWFGAHVLREAWATVRRRWADQGARSSWLEDVERDIMERNTARLYGF